MHKYEINFKRHVHNKNDILHNLYYFTSKIKLVEDLLN